MSVSGSLFGTDAAGGGDGVAGAAGAGGSAVVPAWPAATWPAATRPAGHDGPAPTGRPCGAAATDAGHGVSICLAP